MVKKSVNTLDDVDVEALDAAMNGKSKKVKPSKAPSKPLVTKKAVAVPKTAFRVHTMSYNDRTKKYGKTEAGAFDEIEDVLEAISKAVDDGQGNGLHEVSLYVR